MAHIDYNSIKRKVERERCTKHNQNPKFKKTLKGFEIAACCEEFRSKVIKKTERIVADETKIAVEKMLKKAFR